MIIILKSTVSKQHPFSFITVGMFVDESTPPRLQEYVSWYLYVYLLLEVFKELKHFQ